MGITGLEDLITGVGNFSLETDDNKVYTRLVSRSNGARMQAILAIIQTDDVETTLEWLSVLNLPCVEQIASSGGFLQQNNTALWLAAPIEQVDAVLRTLRHTCHRRVTSVPSYYDEMGSMLLVLPMEVEVGGATVFICDIDQFEVF